ncbi:MAG: hypothetical protein HY978_04175 [Candidatus Liptonbacteria bacterium]|nr:hypothetical protein [Candidatus Liptonbacteria bacterium]
MFPSELQELRALELLTNTSPDARGDAKRDLLNLFTVAGLRGQAIRALFYSRAHIADSLVKAESWRGAEIVRLQSPGHILNFNSRWRVQVLTELAGKIREVRGHLDAALAKQHPRPPG